MTAPAMLERLREHTKARTDAALALELGIEKSMVCRIKLGERSNFELKLLHRMASNAGLPIGQLAEWWAEGQQEPDGI